jgi:hypothetical protein
MTRRLVFRPACWTATSSWTRVAVAAIQQATFAVGRCTLDFATGLGLCTFTDGTGQLAGFHARVDVSALGGRQWAWDGTYRFRSEHERER